MAKRGFDDPYGAPPFKKVRFVQQVGNVSDDDMICNVIQ